MWLFLRGNTNIRGEFGSKLTEISPIQAMTSRVAVTYSGASESTAHSLTQNINAIIMFPSNAPRISAPRSETQPSNTKQVLHLNTFL